MRTERGNAAGHAQEGGERVRAMVVLALEPEREQALGLEQAPEREPAPPSELAQGATVHRGLVPALVLAHPSRVRGRQGPL